MQKKLGRPKKEVRKATMVATRLTQELHDALHRRAYEENKSASVIVVEALIKHLDFKYAALTEIKALGNYVWELYT